MRLLARATGGIVFRAGDVHDELLDVAADHYAAVFELLDGGRTLVGGRPVYYTCATCSEFLFHAGGMWSIGSDTSEAKGYWLVYSNAHTPDRIAEAWKERDHANKLWHRVTSATAVRATAAARAQGA